MREGLLRCKQVLQRLQILQPPVQEAWLQKQSAGSDALQPAA
jgi:hypothetical protein